MNLSALHSVVRDLARGSTGTLPCEDHRLSGSERHVLTTLRRRLASAGGIERLIPVGGTDTWTSPSEPIAE